MDSLYNQSCNAQDDDSGTAQLAKLWLASRGHRCILWWAIRADQGSFAICNIKWARRWVSQLSKALCERRASHTHVHTITYSNTQFSWHLNLLSAQAPLSWW